MFSLKLVDLDFYGEIGEGILETVNLAISCTKALKLDRDLEKKLQCIPENSTTQYFKSKIPALQIFINNFEKVPVAS